MPFKKKPTDTKELLQKLRDSNKWKMYYDKLILQSDMKNGGFKTPEDAKKHIDKLVLMKFDRKDPFAAFDTFWENQKRKK